MTPNASDESGSIFNRAFTHIVYPILERPSYSRFATRLDSLRKRERLSQRENQELQWLDVLNLLKHSERTSLFYQKRFAEAGLNPSRVQSPEDLKRLPPLTREDLRLHLRDIQSQMFQPNELLSAATGGTTDTPVPIVRSKESVAWKTAAQWRFNAWAGMRPGDRIFYLWGARRDYAANPSLRWRLYDRQLMGRVWAPTSVLNPEVLESHRLLMNRLAPRVVYAYPTPLAIFCEYLESSKKPFHHPHTAICTAEPLLPAQREVIERVLECPIFEHYGSREFGMIAGECEHHNGMHVNPVAVYLEFEPVKNADTPGLHEILVTDLFNYGMPLIRYRPNDCVLISPRECACDHHYPLIGQVVGRTGDVFVLPNGDRIPGVSLTNRVLQTCPALAKTQIIQEALDVFHIRFVPGQSFVPSDLEVLRENLRNFFSTGLKWSFEQVSEIPREPSGKTRFCISRVKINEAPLMEPAGPIDLGT